MHQFFRNAAIAGAVACFALGGASAQAAPAAVDQIFYAPFLSKVADGTTLTYRFVRTAAKVDKLDPSFEDEVKISVAPGGDQKSVKVDLFSGDREIKAGNLSRTGNPVVVSLMEQDVQEMSKILGGSPYYIKNRIMDSMRNDKSAEPIKIDYAGKTVDGWKYTLKPFANDAHKAQLKDYAERTYELTFSDDVPGGLYALKTVTPKQNGDGPLLVEELTLKSDRAPTAETNKQ